MKEPNTTMDNSKKFTFRYHQVSFNNGILIQTYLQELNHITLPIAKEIIEERNNLCAEKKYPVLVDPNQLAKADNEARVYLGQKESNRLVLSGALVVNNDIAKLLGNFYLCFAPLSFPAKLFTDFNRAFEWSKQFRRIN